GEIRIGTSPESGELEKVAGVNVLTPDEMSVLAILLLVLVHRLGGHGHERRVLGLKEGQGVRVCFQTWKRRNLILRHCVQEHPTETRPVVMLIVTTEIGLVSLTLSVENGMAGGRRLNPAVRGRKAVQHVIPELFPHRAAVFEGWIDRFIRPAEHLRRSEPRL